MTIPFPMPTFPSPTAAMPPDAIAFNARGNDNQLIAGLNQVQASIAALGHTLTFGTHLQAAGTSYNGSANVTIATDATSANTVSTLVARDGSGNFSANAVTLASTLTLTAAVSKIIPGATSFNVMDTTGARANFNVPNAGGMFSNCATGEIPALSFTGTNGDMPAGAILVNTGLVTGHRALSIFANDGTAGITVGAYYFTQSAVETVWQYANAIGKAQGSTAFQFYPKGGEVSFGQNYAASSSTKAFIRMYGTTTTNLGGSATLIVQQGGISTDTLTASALISANGGLTVASGQTLTVTGATVTGLTFPSVGGSISYAQLPTGPGTWNTGSPSNTVTLVGSLSPNAITGAVTVSGQLNFTNATAAFTIQPGGSVLSVVATSQTGVASVTIPNFAGVNDTFAFLTLAQTLSNKTLDASCTIVGPVLTTQGGTGLASYTAGDLPYYAGATAFTKLAIGAANTVLTSTGSAPQWSTNLAYAALPTGNGTWAANGQIIVQGASTNGVSTALSIQQVNVGTSAAAALNATLYDSASTPVSAGAMTFAKTLAWTNGSPTTFTSSWTLALQNNAVLTNVIVVDYRAFNVAINLPLLVTTTATNIFTAGADASNQLDVGLNGGSTPTANRNSVISIDGASSATFPGQQLLQFRQAGVVGWSIGQTFNLTALHGTATDLVFAAATGTPMAVLTAAGVMRSAGGFVAKGGAAAIFGTLDAFALNFQTNSGTKASISSAGDFSINSTKFTVLFASGNITTAGLIATYNNVATAGFGVPAIYASGRKTAQSAASGTVATYTPAADGTFRVVANVNVTTATLFSFTVTCTYTDETGAAQTLTLPFAQVAGTLLTTLTNATGAGPYEGFPLVIRAKGANAITIQTASGGTYTTVVFNISASIEQLAA